MVLRSRDSRRRRVILDESVQSKAVAPALVSPNSISKASQNTSDSDKPKRLFGFGAERRSQPKTTDLIPKRWFSYTLVLMLLFMAIVSLNGLALYAGALRPYIGEAGVAAVSLQGTGSLASWFTTALLGLGAAVCWQVYLLRKHRCDDYRGSYRIWPWAAITFLLGSIGSAVPLSEVAHSLIAATMGPLPAVGSVSMLGVVSCVAFTTMVLVGWWETRESLGSVTLLLLSWIAGVISVTVASPAVFMLLNQSVWSYVAPNAWLVFVASSFLFVMTYARHVYLAANGMLPVRLVNKDEVRQFQGNSTRAPAKKQSTKQVTKAARQPVATRGGAKLKNGKPASAESAANPAAVDGQKATVTSSPAAPEQPTLSKAERRRKRKLERRQKRAA